MFLCGEFTLKTKKGGGNDFRQMPILWTSYLCPVQICYMKKIAAFFALSILLLSAANAQTKKWKEMDAFHTVMGETFHPSEEGKLEPVRKRSGELVEKAVAWFKSEAPDGFNKSAIKSTLKKLVKEAKALDKRVRANAPDEVIKEKLGSLHHLFHTIEENCEKQ
jgi:hypothetical protein